MSTNKKNLLKSILGWSDFGCGCSNTNLPDIVQPQPIPTRVLPSDNHGSNSTSSASGEDRTSATFSFHVNSSDQNCSELENDPMPTAVDVTPRAGSPFPSSGIGGSVAVVKESDHPYRDFRDSMLRMILEKGIYSRDGLEDLLRCFLEINSPCYHGVIVQVFAEIWQGVVSDRVRPRG